ncbi:MAG TPA: hypothetical protein VK186_17980 [Candidatus Deferrimicrobium sp.]|nr:hypothetical protein [Candidatus Kapabacteria bacterium]HLP60738.1 hypothetical protein [Candidatus Deferrimicrobium sp.]
MKLFINECSLHGQFYNDLEFTEAVKVFYSIFLVLNKCNVKKTLFKNAELFINYKALRDELFVSSLNHSLRDKSLAQALKGILFNKQNAIDWNDEQQHSLEDSFEYDNVSVSGTSMAELAEQKLNDLQLLGVLINFPKSKFEHLEIARVLKNKTNEIDLECIQDKFTLEKWLDKHSLLLVYDEASQEPPTDSQTVLRDSRRFQVTSMPFQQGRKVYREIDTGYYWYVDNLHRGKASHIEVFSKNFQHLGEADLQGHINYKSADKTKKLM